MFPDRALMGAQSDSVRITSLKVTQVAMCLILYDYILVVFILATEQLERQKILKTLYSHLTQCPRRTYSG